jgi:hypothetical protein
LEFVMIRRALPNALMLAALIGFGAAAYAYFYLGDEPGATAEESDREFPDLAVGNNEVRFRLHNPTRHPVRIVGCQFC